MTRHDVRAGNGRFTAERTTTKTVTTEEVTERVIVEPPPPPPPVPVLASDPAPVFAHLLRHPPGGARWAHPDFIADVAARAAGDGRQETFVVPYADTAPIPVIRVPVARTYPELDPDLLDSQFTARDRARLALALDHDGSV